MINRIVPNDILFLLVISPKIDALAHCIAQALPHTPSNLLAWSDVAVLVGEDDFHTPIQLTTGGSVVAGNRKRLTITARSDTVTVDPLVDQSRSHGIGAPIRELLIEAVTAGAVGVAFNQYLVLRVLLEKIGQLLHVAHTARFQLRLVGTEQYVAKCDHQAAFRFLGI